MVGLTVQHIRLFLDRMSEWMNAVFFMLQSLGIDVSE